MADGKLFIGTSGWHYKDWRGEYYPQTLKTAEWLAFYAKDFITTEINSSFYRLPSVDVVKGWMDTVPAQFRFSPKLSRYLTHMKKLNDPEEPFERFFRIFEPMKRRLGMVLLQLPPNLHYKEEKIVPVYELIKHHYPEYRFAIEVRHESWMVAESISLMREYDIAFTISQQGVGWPYAEHQTSRNIYVRFHGPKKLFASPYPDAMLKEYGIKFRQWLRAGHDIYAYFNNDWYAYAIHNAQTLLKMVQG